MSEQTMSRDEMVVGSYVCAIEGDGPRGVVTQVEIDERGPEYDLLHVKVVPWGQPQRCQRVVMMLAERPEPEPVPVPKVEQGATVQWRHDTMPDGVWRRGIVRLRSRGKWEVEDAAGFMVHVDDIEACIMVAKDGLPLTAEEQLAALKVELKSAVESRDMATALLHKRQRDYDGMHAALLRAEKGHADVQEELEKARDELVTAQAVRAELDALRLDHAALKSTDAETEAAYLKTHGERYALNEQNIELRAELAELEAELERRSKVSHEKYAALERDRDLVENAMREASARAQRNGDSLKAVLTREEALRAQLIALEEGAAASRNTARQVAQIAHDRAYEIERQKHEIAHVESREREALAQAAAQRERADMWQAAAQDALDQMAHWRKQAIEEASRCKAIADMAHDDQRLRYADQSRLTGLLDGMDRAKGISPNDGARVAKLEIVNHRGERRVMQLLASTCRLHHEPTEHYPRRTLKVTGYDIDRAAMRTVEIAQLRDEEEA